MSSLRAWALRVMAIFRKGHLEQELAEELNFHREMLVEEYARKGMSPVEARYAARRTLGGVEQVKEIYRDQRGLPMIETLARDIHYGLRMLGKNPGFTAVVVLTLALGIGANTAIFSVVNAVLIKPFPYKDPDRLVVVWEQLQKLGLSRFAAPLGNYYDYRDQNHVFERLAVLEYAYFDFLEVDQPERILGARISADLFTLLGVSAALGRTFLPEENQPGHDQVAVLSDSLWKRRFGSDPHVMGRAMILDGIHYKVIGVMHRSLRFSLGNSSLPEVWLPIAFQSDPRRESGHLQMIARLKPGVSVEEARADMKALAGRLEQEFHLYRGPQGQDAGYDVAVIPLREEITGNSRDGLLVMLGAVSFVLLIACANVANLLLARATTRQREIAVRAALGASRVRLVRQLLTEGLLLGVMGGCVALVIAYWSIGGLVRWSPYEVTRLFSVDIDGSVLGFSLGLSFLTGLIFGLVPIIGGARTNLTLSLKEAARGAVAVPSRGILRRALVVIEVALSLSMVVGAGLLVRSFIAIRNVNPGFNPESVLTAQISLPEPEYRENNQVAEFYQGLLERIDSLPGVKSASLISALPLSGGDRRDPFSIEGQPWRPFGANRTPQVAAYMVAAPDYFRTMQIPLIKGREFTMRDVDGTVPVAIVNETLVRGFWPGENPVGKHIMMGAPRERVPWLTVVGVVADVKDSGLDSTPIPQIYAPQFEIPSRSMTLVMRTHLEPMTVVPAVQHEVQALDKSRPLYGITSLEQVLSETVASRRHNMLLLGVLAALALLLAAVGIYGVISYSVAQRTYEIGIRLALGADPGNIINLMVRHGLVLATVGLVIGLGSAFGLTRLLSGMLFGVRPYDLTTFVGVSLLLMAVAFLACYIPARRATKIDPMVALRYE
ncbi:MAG TPA: ABC transporter permease [Terriglobia bacterium]|nr:ABC transporter permease [Terriglobia bacterium]